MKRGFTLIELLVVIAIMGLMVTVGIVSVRSGQGAARVKGAARDLVAAIRHARSVALVTQQPAIITYSVEEEDGEPVAKIEVTSTKLFDSERDRSNVTTITGDPVKLDDDETPPAEGAEGEAKKGNTIEDVLFAPIGAEILKGMRLKAVIGDDLPDSEAPRRSKISVFSNVDYLLGRYRDAKKKETTAEATAKESEKNDTAAENQEPVSIVWETNGRVDAHQVWIYPDGKKPEDGLLIRIDRFGGTKVLNGDGREDE